MYLIDVLFFIQVILQNNIFVSRFKPIPYNFSLSTFYFMRIITLCLVSIFFTICSIQKPSAQTPEAREAVIDVVKQLFDGMTNNDTTKVRNVFTKDAQMVTITPDKDGKLTLLRANISEFVKAVGKKNPEKMVEHVWNYEVQMDGNLASVWCDYTFYIGNRVSHCGVDAFQLFKADKTWKIFQLSDTRHKDDCRANEMGEVNMAMDKWHDAAAHGDEEVFFKLMDSEAIYLGTDAGERWNKEEFKKWSKPHFDKDVAWAFKPKKRTVYFSDKGQYAWFDETLDTWMGECRGTGVMRRLPEGWRIKHYNLSISVPNGMVKDFISLVQKQKK
jgi:SnoaL-like domain/Putative lumazine-binding